MAGKRIAKEETNKAKPFIERILKSDSIQVELSELDIIKAKANQPDYIIEHNRCVEGYMEKARITQSQGIPEEYMWSQKYVNGREVPCFD